MCLIPLKNWFSTHLNPVFRLIEVGITKPGPAAAAGNELLRNRDAAKFNRTAYTNCMWGYRIMRLSDRRLHLKHSNSIGHSDMHDYLQIISFRGRKTHRKLRGNCYHKQQIAVIYYIK